MFRPREKATKMSRLLSAMVSRPVRRAEMLTSSKAMKAMKNGSTYPKAVSVKIRKTEGRGSANGQGARYHCGEKLPVS